MTELSSRLLAFQQVNYQFVNLSYQATNADLPHFKMCLGPSFKTEPCLEVALVLTESTESPSLLAAASALKAADIPTQSCTDVASGNEDMVPLEPVDDADKRLRPLVATSPSKASI